MHGDRPRVAIADPGAQWAHWAGDFAPLGDALPLGVIASAGMATVVYLNALASTMLGRPHAELLGHGWEEAVHPDDRADLISAVAVVLDSGARQRVVVATVADPERRLEMTLAPLGGADAPTGWLATVDDVTERQRAEQRLTYEATHDHLTHLPNRSLLADRLLLAGRRLDRAGPEAALAVLFVDLDDFKSVNDRLGHATGDHVLRTTATRLVHAVRAGDTVARLGGDEFVAVCELASIDEADALARRVEEAVSAPIAVGSTTLVPRASVGLAVTRTGSDPDELLARADQAMYRRKAARSRARTRPVP